MRKRKIINLVLKLSGGLFSSLIDLVLWNIFFLTEVSLSGSPGKIKKAELLANKDFQYFNSETIKRAIARAKSRGFIKEDFTLTKEGKERLERIFPKYFGEKKWDGNWYLVAYDIPEHKKRLRDILRESLKRLGFGQLQASVWISPFNFLGEVEKIIKDYKLSPYVILAISDKVGKEEAKILAKNVWKLEKINKLYENLLNKFEKSKERKFYFEYLKILDKDPQLPKELLPSDWKGEKVHKLFAQVRRSK